MSDEEIKSHRKERKKVGRKGRGRNDGLIF